MPGRDFEACVGAMHPLRSHCFVRDRAGFVSDRAVALLTAGVRFVGTRPDFVVATVGWGRGPGGFWQRGPLGRGGRPVTGATPPVGDKGPRIPVSNIQLFLLWSTF